MSSIYDSRQRLKYVFIIIALVIAVVSVYVSDIFVRDLAHEERQKIELWYEAMQNFAKADPSQDMTLNLKIMESTTIPIIRVAEDGSIIESNNIPLPEKNREQFLKKKLQEFRSKRQPVAYAIDENVHEYLYYDDSIILKRLALYPYAQLGVIFIFILIAFLAFTGTKKAEQNKVWVGLSKETAHQLGTPISSLVAWVEYLKTKDMDPALLDEMAKDVRRLETIAERFSKIGSKPDQTPVDINNSIRQALDYMGTRISAKVRLTAQYTGGPALVSMSDSLFAWVIENLVKNAVDAMDGQGRITVSVGERKKSVFIDIADTGKGIQKSKFDTIFSPGYTTKARGWGLGLSLVRRIIESYNNGKIYVKSSEIGKGTTFRIELKKYRT